jgi:diguanylate cyclase (GGDEF)-like protein
MEPPTAGLSSKQWNGPRRAGLLTLVGLSYFLSGKLGLALASVHPSATLVWAPTGIALAACLIVGMWVWPAIFVAAFAVNVTNEGSVWTSLAIGVGNTLEPLAATHLVNRFADGSRSFETVRGVASYALFAGMLSPVAAATVGVTALALGGYAAWTSYGSVWLTWWAGDVGGALVVAPFILLWVYPPPMQWTGAKVLEAGIVSVATAFASLAVFGGVLPLSARHYPVDFLCLPFVGWAALRLSPRVAATAILLLSAVAVWGTVKGNGPFADHPAPSGLLLLGAYIAVTAVGTLLFAATVRERLELIARLRDLSQSDPLTGLANYRRLTAVLENEKDRSDRHQRPFALVLLDLDRLKSLNDRFGHVTGSRALCRVANALRDTCRAVDTAARYGGDEFALVLPETDRDAAATVATRIQRRLAEDSEHPPISASVGCAVYPEDGETIETLVRSADGQLYRGKSVPREAKVHGDA